MGQAKCKSGQLEANLTCINLEDGNDTNHKQQRSTDTSTMQAGKPRGTGPRRTERPPFINNVYLYKKWQEKNATGSERRKLGEPLGYRRTARLCRIDWRRTARLCRGVEQRKPPLGRNCCPRNGWHMQCGCLGAMGPDSQRPSEPDLRSLHTETRGTLLL